MVDDPTTSRSTRFSRFFPNRPRTLLPVIHVVNTDQAKRNVDLVRAGGADGVFLVNHDTSHQELLKIAHLLARTHRDFFVGVNCLDLRPQDVFYRLTPEIRGVCVNNAGVHAGLPETLDAVRTARHETGWPGLYFGGVAFKYQPLHGSPADAAAAAVGQMDVITTSGPGAGSAPTIEKVQAMRNAIGDHPLAIASGLTPENITEFLPYADCYLVSTGISRNPRDLDPAKLTAFQNRIRQLPNPSIP